MKVIKPDTEFVVIQKWFNEIADFISSPALSHIEIKLKEREFIELDIFYDNNEHVNRIKFTDQTYQLAINQLIHPKPLFRRELRPDELLTLKELAQKIIQGQEIIASWFLIYILIACYKSY